MGPIPGIVFSMLVTINIVHIPVYKVPSASAQRTIDSILGSLK